MFLQIHNKDIHTDTYTHTHTHRDTHFTSKRYLEIKHDDAIILLS